MCVLRIKPPTNAVYIRVVREDEPRLIQQRRPIPLEFIVQSVCRSMGVQVAEVLGRNKHWQVVLARTMCSLACRQMTYASYPEIAIAISRSNHSTCVTAVRRVEGQMRGDEAAPVEAALSPRRWFEGQPIREIAIRCIREASKAWDELHGRDEDWIPPGSRPTAAAPEPVWGLWDFHAHDWKWQTWPIRRVVRFVTLELAEAYVSAMRMGAGVKHLMPQKLPPDLAFVPPRDPSEFQQ